MIRLLGLFAVFFGAIHPFFAQEQLGLRLERFSGISSAVLNPANLSGMALKWDANLVGATVFGETNYGFFQNSGVPKVLRSAQDTSNFFVKNYEPEQPAPKPGQIVLDFEARNRNFYGELRVLAMLPAFAVHLGERNTVGFSTHAHLDAMTHSIKSPLGYPTFNQRPRFEEFQVGRMAVAGMAWSEAAAHFSRKTDLDNFSLAIGGSLRFLMAHEAVFAQSLGTFSLEKLQGDSLLFTETEFVGGATTSNFPTYLDKKPRFSINGKGLGLDLGFVFTKIDDDLDDNDYPWKIGFSIIDIGKINLKKNAEKHRFYQDSSFVIDPNDFSEFIDPHQLIRIGSAKALVGDSLASLVGSRFDVRLPLAVCAQGDFRVAPYLYVNGTLVQRVDFQKTALQRPNILAITPRFEHRWLSASMPFILSEWQTVRFGLAARLGFLVIGTDDLGSFFQQKKLNSSDFYVALKISSFRFWGENAREKGRTRRRDRVKCYDF